jgi:hypothetical protein
MAFAADTARKLGRSKLAELIDAEVGHYQEQAEPLAIAYQEVNDALLANPDLTFAQIKRWLASQYGLKFREVGKVVLRGLGTVYQKACKEGLEARKIQQQRNGGRGRAEPGVGGDSPVPERTHATK